ncbi:hypothetical protein ACQEXU_21825 [Vibrio sp. TRT 21S02]|uniref:hypothetical protein n=1 Tax=Vibrio sp. TRT 21S02 TaxID=3418507 RepID=UPI003CF434C9
MIRKIRPILILSICVVFMMAGAANQGITGFIFSLPFVGLFIYKLKAFSVKAKIVSVITAAFLIAPLAWNHEKNKIIYPWLGDEFIASCGWEAIKYEKKFTGYSYTTLVPRGAEIYEKYVISRDPIPCDVPWKLTRVLVMYPSLATTYYPVFSIAGYEAVISGYELNNAFESQLIMHHQISSSYELQSKWTNYLSALMMWPAIPMWLQSLAMYFFV